MSENNITAKSRHIFRYFSWKIILGFIALPILMNLMLLITILSHFTTYNGAPIAEMFADILLYVGNWPSLLLKMYPYDLSNDGEVHYDIFGMLEPITFIINLLGWGLVGFVSSYAIRKSKDITSRI